MKKLIPSLLIAVLILFGSNVPDRVKEGAVGAKNKVHGHKCGYALCPFKNQIQFTGGCGNCDEGSDCWALDSVHFTNPSLFYDDCEEMLFKK